MSSPACVSLAAPPRLTKTKYRYQDVDRRASDGIATGLIEYFVSRENDARGERIQRFKFNGGVLQSRHSHGHSGRAPTACAVQPQPSAARHAHSLTRRLRAQWHRFISVSLVLGTAPHDVCVRAACLRYDAGACFPSALKTCSSAQAAPRSPPASSPPSSQRPP